MSPSARVDERSLVVPLDVTDPVVVTFDGQYVWSFDPVRDGVRSRGTWEVSWPDAVQDLLDGKTRVRLGDAREHRVIFDAEVAFRGNTAALALRDRQGHPVAVDRAGHLSRVFSEVDGTVRRYIAEGTARALHDLREEVGVDAHVSYGCLLGAVRSGQMIGHDSDADLAYLSRFTHPADIARESYRMERALRTLGWKVVRMSGADLKLFLPLPDDRVVQIDVFAAFHVGETFFQMGGRSGILPRAAITPATTVTLEGVELAAPADPDAVLAFLYGPGWRTPDPSFQNVDPISGLRRLSGWFGGSRRHLSRWNQLYRSRRHDVPRGPSSFAPWVGSRIPAGACVVDVGCGLGRDSGWFARHGFDVVGLDYSSAALRTTRRVLRQRGVSTPDTRALLLNDLRTTLLTGAELVRLPEPPHLYGRGLLDSIDPEARTNLWVLCSMALRRGGSLHLEHSATGGLARPGLRPRRVDGLVRRVSTSRVVREIEASGGRVEHVEHGVGTGLHDDADPYVARLEARWDRPSPSLQPDREGAPMFKDTIQETPVEQAPGLGERLRSLPAIVRDLSASVQENRRLNRRVAELTDVVAELLVPLADRDEEKARELLAEYRKNTLGA